ncbi:protein-export chaperone SecB [Roseospirillum parvum]|uniref:Protein-export protein SecB n=1 Tax=Roseospirillum parvum TaxID=83401 RepID=A0A1G8DL37_9PROT|nr:protein-export chaperone SecB [Roseospirillum parvum]SDH58423.1 preprotein translocase subunit SecB [Roseospirillum parvum]
MADAPDTPTPDPQNQAPQPPLVINMQYVKDLSFESPNTPHVFAELSRNQPEIPISVDVEVSRLSKESPVFEVILGFNAESRLGERKVFVLELKYAATITVNAAQEHMEPLIMVEAPRVMFPFARQIIAETTGNGGFPPLMLQPIDFLALYQQRRAQANAQAQG